MSDSLTLTHLLVLPTGLIVNQGKDLINRPLDVLDLLHSLIILLYIHLVLLLILLDLQLQFLLFLLPLIILTETQSLILINLLLELIDLRCEPF